MSTQQTSGAPESRSTTSSRMVGRKNSWWTTECFSLRTEADATSSDAALYTTCNGCGWKSRAATPNATQLGHHLLKCSFTSPDTLAKLLKTPSLLRAYRELGSSAEIFGVPVTPSKRRRRSSEGVARRGDASDPRTDERSDLGIRSLLHRERALTDKRSCLNGILTRLIVNHMLPFTVLSKSPDQCELRELIRLLDPRLEEDVPTIARMAGKGVQAYYQKQLKHVKCSISASLRQAYGTLIFDGWTDASCESVVNVLLTITGVDKTRKSYFLRSIYTGSESCDANLYANIVDSVFSDFGDMTRVCAIVSDNASSCVKAKEQFVQKHNHIIANQDQTHVANLLMQDIGQLDWVNDILASVSGVVSDLRKHSKLYFRFKQLKEQHNTELRNQGYTTTNRELDSYGRIVPLRTAVLPMRMAPTRFASSEGMLHSFLRGKTVFQRLVDCADFSTTLYTARGKQKRDMFVSTVKDDALYEKCLDVYHVFRLMRHYLRIFDDDSSVISEVYPSTNQLEQQLLALPLTPFFTQERKDQVVHAFRRRRNGEARKIPLLTSLHSVSYCLDIRSINVDIAPFNAAILKHLRAYVASDVFPPTRKLPSSGGVEAAVHDLFEELTFTRLSWRTQADNPGQRDVLMAFKNIPVVYWIQCNNRQLLREFALRILSVSPSSSSVERSFSLQGRIRTPTRNRLHPMKVEMMMFCAFNRALTSTSRRARSSVRRSHVELYTSSSSTVAQTNTDNLVSYFLVEENVDIDQEEENNDEELLDWENVEDDSEGLPETGIMRSLFE